MSNLFIFLINILAIISFSTASNSAPFVLKYQKNSISPLPLASNPIELKLPQVNSTNITHLDYDVNRNCIYFASAKTIHRQCGNQNESAELLVACDVKQVSGLAYDWMSNLLYFADSMRYTIETINVTNRHRRTIITSNERTAPTNIQLHPKRRCLFWTAWMTVNNKLIDASIYRANLDGSGVHALVISNRVDYPTAISIDRATDRIYWNDGHLNFIASCDLWGKDVQILLVSDEYETTFGLSVYDDLIYFMIYRGGDRANIVAVNKGKHTIALKWQCFDDFQFLCIFPAGPKKVMIIQSNQPEIKNLQVYGGGSQHGTHACGIGEHNCANFCIPSAEGKANCYCADGLTMTAAGLCQCNDTVFEDDDDADLYECLELVHTCSPLSPDDCKNFYTEILFSQFKLFLRFFFQMIQRIL